MNTQRIRMTHHRDEPTPRNVFTDFDWIRQHQKALLEQYGECSIIVYQEKVIGVGQTYTEAVLDAERNLAPEIAQVTPVHQRLRQRNPFFRIKLHSQK